MPRFPTRNESITLLFICAFPIHFWSLFIFLHDLPSFLMHYSAFQIASILAYVLVFALFETLIATGSLYFLAGLLPAKWLRTHLTSQSLVLAFITAIWMAAAQFWIWKTINPQNSPEETSIMGISSLVIALCILVTYLAVLWILSSRLRASLKFEVSLQNAAERLGVLSTLFLIADAISICLVIARNIG